MKFLHGITYLKICSSKRPFSLIHSNILKKSTSVLNFGLRSLTSEPDFKSAEQEVNKSSKVRALKKPSEKSKLNVIRSLEKETYFQDVKDFIPEKLFKQKRSVTESLYLINKDTAYDLLFPILPYLQTSSAGESHLIEINPGLGLLTDLLLNNWSREINLYESTKQFYTSLNSIKEVHQNRINLKYANFYDVWKLSYQDKHNKGRKVDDLLEGINPVPWGKEFCSTIIGCLPPNSFINHLMMSLIFQHSLMMWGRHQFFFVLTPIQYIQYTCNRDFGYRMYRASTVMFQILFEYKLLCKVPRKSFLPWVYEEKNVKTRSAKIRNLDSEYMYVVRLEPRANLYELCKAQDLKQLWYFIRHNCLSRKNRIIPHLERWVPNCGPRLITSPSIKKPVSEIKPMNIDGFNINVESTYIYDNDYYPNMTIFTEFGDLNPSQLLSLFMQFKSWPEFSESTFITSMENLLLKMENSEEILDEEEDIDLVDEIEHDSEKK